MSSPWYSTMELLVLAAPFTNTKWHGYHYHKELHLYQIHHPCLDYYKLGNLNFGINLQVLKSTNLNIYTWYPNQDHGIRSCCIHNTICQWIGQAWWPRVFSMLAPIFGIFILALGGMTKVCQSNIRGWVKGHICWWWNLSNKSPCKVCCPLHYVWCQNNIRHWVDLCYNVRFPILCQMGMDGAIFIIGWLGGLQT